MRNIKVLKGVQNLLFALYMEVEEAFNREIPRNDLEEFSQLEV